MLHKGGTQGTPPRPGPALKKTLSENEFVRASPSTLSTSEDGDVGSEIGSPLPFQTGKSSFDPNRSVSGVASLNLSVLNLSSIIDDEYACYCLELNEASPREGKVVLEMLQPSFDRAVFSIVQPFTKQLEAEQPDAEIYQKVFGHYRELNNPVLRSLIFSTAFYRLVVANSKNVNDCLDIIQTHIEELSPEFYLDSFIKQVLCSPNVALEKLTPLLDTLKVTDLIIIWNNVIEDKSFTRRKYLLDRIIERINRCEQIEEQDDYVVCCMNSLKELHDEEKDALIGFYTSDYEDSEEKTEQYRDQNIETIWIAARSQNSNMQAFNKRLREKYEREALKEKRYYDTLPSLHEVVPKVKAGIFEYSDACGEIVDAVINSVPAVGFVYLPLLDDKKDLSIKELLDKLTKAIIDAAPSEEENARKYLAALLQVITSKKTPTRSSLLIEWINHLPEMSQQKFNGLITSVFSAIGKDLALFLIVLRKTTDKLSFGDWKAVIELFAAEKSSLEILPRILELADKDKYSEKIKYLVQALAIRTYNKWMQAEPAEIMEFLKEKEKNNILFILSQILVECSRNGKEKDRQIIKIIVSDLARYLSKKQKAQENNDTHVYVLSDENLEQTIQAGLLAAFNIGVQGQSVDLLVELLIEQNRTFNIDIIERFKEIEKLSAKSETEKVRLRTMFLELLILKYQQGDNYMLVASVIKSFPGLGREVVHGLLGKLSMGSPKLINACLRLILGPIQNKSSGLGIDENYRQVLYFFVQAGVTGEMADPSSLILFDSKENGGVLTPNLALEMLYNPSILLDLCNHYDSPISGSQLPKNFLITVFQQAAEVYRGNPLAQEREMKKVAMNFFHYFSQYNPAKITEVLNILFSKKDKRIFQVGTDERRLRDYILNFYKNEIFNEAFQQPEIKRGSPGKSIDAEDKDAQTIIGYLSKKDGKKISVSQLNINIRILTILHQADVAEAAKQMAGITPVTDEFLDAWKADEKSPRRTIEIILYSSEDIIQQNTGFLARAFQYFAKTSQGIRWLKSYKKEFFDNIEWISKSRNGAIVIATFIEAVISNQIMQYLTPAEKQILFRYWPKEIFEESFDSKKLLFEEMNVLESVQEYSPQEVLMALDSLVLSLGSYADDQLRHWQRTYLPDNPALLGQMFLSLLDPDFNNMTSESKQHLKRALLKKIYKDKSPVKDKAFLDNISSPNVLFALFDNEEWYEGLILLPIIMRNLGEKSFESFLYENFALARNANARLREVIKDFLLNPDVYRRIDIRYFEQIFNMDCFPVEQRSEVAVELLKDELMPTEKYLKFVKILGDYLSASELIELCEKTEYASEAVICLLKNDDAYAYEQHVMEGFNSVNFIEAIKCFDLLIPSAKEKAIKLFINLKMPGERKDEYIRALFALLNDAFAINILSLDELLVLDSDADFAQDELGKKIASLCLQKKEVYADAFFNATTVFQSHIRLKSWFSKVNFDIWPYVKELSEAARLRAISFLCEMENGLLTEKESQYFQAMANIPDDVLLKLSFEQLRALHERTPVIHNPDLRVRLAKLLLKKEECYQESSAAFLIELCRLFNHQQLLDYLALLPDDQKVRLASHYLTLDILKPDVQYWELVADISADLSPLEKIYNQLVEWLKVPENINRFNPEKLKVLAQFLKPEDARNIWLAHYTALCEKRSVLAFQAGLEIASEEYSDATHQRHLDISTTLELMHPHILAENNGKDLEIISQELTGQASALDKFQAILSSGLLIEIFGEESEKRLLSNEEFKFFISITRTQRPQQLLNYVKKVWEYRKYYENIKTSLEELSRTGDIKPFNKWLSENYGLLRKYKSIAEAAGAYDLVRWLDGCIKAQSVDAFLRQIGNDPEFLAAEKKRLVHTALTYLTQYEGQFTKAKNTYSNLLSISIDLQTKVPGLFASIKMLNEQIESYQDKETEPLWLKANKQECEREYGKCRLVLLEQFKLLKDNLTSLPDMTEEDYREILNGYIQIVFKFYAGDTVVLNAFQSIMITMSSLRSPEAPDEFLGRLLGSLPLVKYDEQRTIDPRKVLLISAVGGMSISSSNDGNVDNQYFIETRRRDCELILKASLRYAVPRIDDSAEQKAERDSFRRLTVQYLKHSSLLQGETELLHSYLQGLEEGASETVTSFHELMENVRNQAVLRGFLSEPQQVVDLGEDIDAAARQLDGVNKMYRLYLISQLTFDVNEYKQIIEFKQEILRFVTQGNYVKAREALNKGPITEIERNRLLTPALRSCFGKDPLPSKEVWNNACAIEEESIAFLKGRKGRLEQFESDVLVRALQRQFYETCAYEQRQGKKATVSPERIERAKRIYAAYMKKRLEDYRQGFLRDKIARLAEYVGRGKGDVEKEREAWFRFLYKHQRSFEARELESKVDASMSGVGSSVFAKNALGQLIKIAELQENNELKITHEYVARRIALEKAVQDYRDCRSEYDRTHADSEFWEQRLKELSANIVKKESEWRSVKNQFSGELGNISNGVFLYSSDGQIVGVYRESLKQERQLIIKFVYAFDSTGKKIKVGELGFGNQIKWTDDRLLIQEQVGLALKKYYDYVYENRELDESQWTEEKKAGLKQLDGNVKIAQEALALAFKTKGELLVRSGTRLLVGYDGRCETEGYYDETLEGIPTWRQDNAFVSSKDILKYFDVEHDREITLRVVPALIQDILSEGGLADFYETELSGKTIKTQKFLKSKFLERLKVHYFNLTEADLSSLVKHHTSKELIGLLKSFSEREDSFNQAKIILEKMLLNEAHCKYFASSPQSRASLLKYCQQLKVTNEEAKRWMEFTYPTAEGNRYIPDLLITQRVEQGGQGDNIELLRQWNLANLPDEVIETLPVHIKMKWFEKPENILLIESKWDVVIKGFKSENIRSVIQKFLDKESDRLYFVQYLILFAQKYHGILLAELSKAYAHEVGMGEERFDLIANKSRRFFQVFYNTRELQQLAFAATPAFAQMFTIDTLMDGVRYLLSHPENADLLKVLQNVFKLRSKELVFEEQDLDDLLQFMKLFGREEQEVFLDIFNDDLFARSILKAEDDQELKLRLFDLLQAKAPTPNFSVKAENLDLLISFVRERASTLNFEGGVDLENALYAAADLSLEWAYDTEGKIVKDKAQILINKVLSRAWTWEGINGKRLEKWQQFFDDYQKIATDEEKTKVVETTISEIECDLDAFDDLWTKVLSHKTNKKWSFDCLKDTHFAVGSEFLRIIKCNIETLAKEGSYEEALNLYEKIPQSSRDVKLIALMHDVTFEKNLAARLSSSTDTVSVKQVQKEIFAHYYRPTGWGSAIKHWFMSTFWFKTKSDKEQGGRYSNPNVRAVKIQSEVGAVANVSAAGGSALPGDGEGAAVEAAIPVAVPFRAVKRQSSISDTSVKYLKKDISTSLSKLEELWEEYKKNVSLAFLAGAPEGIMDTLGQQITQLRKLIIDICKVLPSNENELERLQAVLDEIVLAITEPSEEIKSKTQYQSRASVDTYVAWDNRGRKKFLDNHLRLLLRAVHKKLMPNRGIIAPRVALFDNPFILQSTPAPLGREHQQYGRMIGGLREALENLKLFKHSYNEKAFDFARIINNIDGLKARIVGEKSFYYQAEVLKRLTIYQTELDSIHEAKKIDEDESIDVEERETFLGLEIWRAIALYYLQNIVESCYSHANNPSIYAYLRRELSQLMKKFEVSIKDELGIMQAEVLLIEQVSAISRTFEKAKSVANDLRIQEYQEKITDLRSIEDETTHCLRYVETCSQLCVDALEDGADPTVVEELSCRLIEAENLAEEEYALSVRDDHYIQSASAYARVVCQESLALREREQYMGVPDELLQGYLVHAGSEEKKRKIILEKGTEWTRKAEQGVDLNVKDKDMLEELEWTGTAWTRKESLTTAQVLESSIESRSRSIDEQQPTSAASVIEDEEFEEYKAEQIAALEELKINGGFESLYLELVLEAVDAMKKNVDFRAWYILDEDFQVAVGACQTEGSSLFARFSAPIKILKKEKADCLDKIKAIEKGTAVLLKLLEKYTVLSIRLALLGETTESYSVQFVETKQNAEESNQENIFYCFKENDVWKYYIKNGDKGIAGEIENLPKGLKSTSEEVIRAISESEQGCTCIGLELERVKYFLDRMKCFKDDNFLDNLIHAKVDLATVHDYGLEGLKEEKARGIEGKIKLLAARVNIMKSMIKQYDKVLSQFPEDKQTQEKRRELMAKMIEIEAQLWKWKQDLENDILNVDNIFEFELYRRGVYPVAEQERTIHLFVDEERVKYCVAIKNDKGEICLSPHQNLSTTPLIERFERELIIVLSQQRIGEEGKKLSPKLTEKQQTDVLRIVASKGYAARNKELLIEFIENHFSKSSFKQRSSVTFPRNGRFFIEATARAVDDMSNSCIGFKYQSVVSDQ